MFIGHFAVGFAAKRQAKTVSLGTLFLGRLGFWGLVAFLLVTHLAAIYGPAPTDVKAIAWGAQSVWLLVLWGYWLDRHREPVGA